MTAQLDMQQVDITQVPDETIAEDTRWMDVCRYDDLLPERGVAALLSGRQVAIFRLAEGEVVALANRDPFSEANVMSRGIVGSRGSVATVASPMYKQVFDIHTGRCLDDESVSLPSYDVRVNHGIVQVAGL